MCARGAWEAEELPRGGGQAVTPLLLGLNVLAVFMPSKPFWTCYSSFCVD